MKQFKLAICAIGLTIAGSVHAEVPAVDLRGVDEALTVEPTKVMVLGTSHLSAYDDLTPEHIAPLLDRLVSFDPQVITIEGVPGETCEMMRTYPSEYRDSLDSYCHDVAPFRAESGLSAAEAAARVRMLLHDWPEAPSASERRQLAAAFLAAGEAYSALVQWWQLAPTERAIGDGLGLASVAYLENRAASMNESSQIGARLAARLGLERVYSADDHSSDLVLTDYGSALWDRMSEIWAMNDPSSKDGSKQAAQDLIEGRVMAAYLFYNDPETQRLALDSDFRRAMNDGEGEQYGRAYNSWYQTRNLRMVSNVVAAGANAPGGRVLSIVGASHKPYFEAYLDLMHDIEIVSTDTVLK